MIYNNPPPIAYELANSISYSIFSYLMFVAAALILFAVLREQKTQSHTWYEAPEDEYNFMASQESEQSRLDLAQAFLDIGHTHDAKIILSELINVKNPLIKEQAKQILRKI